MGARLSTNWEKPKGKAGIRHTYLTDLVQIHLGLGSVESHGEYRFLSESKISLQKGDYRGPIEGGWPHILTARRPGGRRGSVSTHLSQN